MRFHLQCLLVCFLAIIADVLWAWHIVYFLKKDVAVSVSTIFAIHFVSYFYTKWFIEYEKAWQRLAITFYGSLGAAVGCYLVMLWIN